MLAPCDKEISKHMLEDSQYLRTVLYSDGYKLRLFSL